jgi:hypothetical protein
MIEGAAPNYLQNVIRIITESCGSAVDRTGSGSVQKADFDFGSRSVPVSQPGQPIWSHPPGLNRRPADYESTRVKSHV